MNLFPFPQANDFVKVISILYADESRLKDYDYMCEIIGVGTGRQVDYYESACMYLGILTSNKTFTDIGYKLRLMPLRYRDAELARLIVSQEAFGKIYFMQIFEEREFSVKDVEEMLHDYVEFGSDAIYRRRASTVVSWLKWINEAKHY